MARTSKTFKYWHGKQRTIKEKMDDQEMSDGTLALLRRQQRHYKLITTVKTSVPKKTLQWLNW